jgi:myo-inositol 2-dehydrogenase / D-chiro-inositol 1-dehydrogenase
VPLPDSSRRDFLKTSSAAIAAGLFVAPAAAQDKPKSPNERLRVGAIGLRYQGSVIAHKAQMYGDIVAVCDVDFHVRKQAQAAFGSTPRDFEDYRDVIKRNDIDVVLIGAPDHWHSKMIIDACRAGKVVRDVVKETGRVVQVGSWQRSDHRFRQAVEMVHQGRIGDLQSVEVVLGKNVVGGPFKKVPAPNNLNWNLWQGQTPDTPYIQERCHYTFRWWYAYSGGQMTDWGAHHMDIAQWAINSNPVEISATAKYPNTPDGYDVAVDFEVNYRYANGVTMKVLDNGRNGILFTGTTGRIFVNRGSISGKPVDDLAGNPLRREDFAAYDFDNLDRPERMGKLDAIINHMGNFFDCVQARKTPVSSVESQHRSVSTCHLGNIAMKEGRSVLWDPKSETFPNDAAANKLLSREQRTGFEVV